MVTETDVVLVKISPPVSLEGGSKLARPLPDHRSGRRLPSLFAAEQEMKYWNLA